MQKNVTLVDLGKCLVLKNARNLAIVAVDTAENEPLKIWGDVFSYSVASIIRAVSSTIGRNLAVGALSNKRFVFARKF